MAGRNGRDRQMRERIAQEAARLMAEDGLRDFLAAKRKAAQHLGAPATQNMPRNVEIEAALAAYQQLFQGDEQSARLAELRRIALEAMEFLERFQPRLTGSVLSGTAGAHSDINLHLFAETPEEVGLFLMEAHVPFEVGERRLRWSRRDQEDFPLFRFVAGDTVVELLVFPVKGLRQAPLSPVDGKPMKRASQNALEALIAAHG